MPVVAKASSGLQDVSSDDEEDRYDPGVPDPAAPAAEPGIQAENWEDFWRAACDENDRKARAAGGDPTREASAAAPPRCRHGQDLERGIPRGTVRCFGCDEPTEQRLECCQCLEIFKQRAVAVAFDSWERAFWQGGEERERETISNSEQTRFTFQPLHPPPKN
jgi:hypothetical protein